MGYALVGIGEVVYVGMELRVGPKHVVQDTDVVVPQVLGGLYVVPHRSQVGADFNRREGNSYAHVKLLR